MATDRPSKGTWAGRRWKGLGQTGSQTGAGLPEEGGSGGQADMQPAVDPRTTPIPSGLEIHVLEGEDAGKTIPLETWEIVLGRRMTPEEKKTGWVLFNDPTVSRMHAVLEWRPGPRRYRLDHQSRTNPTLINGRLVQQAILYPDDMVRLGDLSFQIRVRRAGTAPDEQHPQVPDRGLIYSGFKLSVVKGREVGRQYVLEHKVIHLGGPTAGNATAGANWIALDDPALPREQAFLVWYDTDKRYGIFHAGTSPVPTQISRVLTAPKTDGKDEARNLLHADDVIILGETVLMVMKHERFMETGRALRGTPAEKETPPPPAEEKRPARKSAFDFTTGRKILEIIPKAREAEKMEPVVRVKGESRPPVPAATPAALPERPFEATSNWFVKPDYVLEVIGGPEAGKSVALRSSAMREDRPVGIGARGKRANDIELPGDEMSNQQACIYFRGGRFTFTNEAGGMKVAINEAPLEAGESMQLKNGDEIEIGKHVLLFIDRQAIERQYQFQLEVIEENGRTDKSRVYTLNQETMNVGRSKTAEIRIEDPKVSRLHAEISFRRGGFVLEHKSETNPTFVNGVSLNVGKERPLEPDDELQLSENTTLVFRRKRALEM